MTATTASAPPSGRAHAQAVRKAARRLRDVAGRLATLDAASVAGDDLIRLRTVVATAVGVVEASERAGADRHVCQACGAPVPYGRPLCDECRQRGTR